MRNANEKKLNIVGVIPARGGSVGVPLKNIRELCGKPLIYYVIKAALASKHLSRVIVSTDHEEIARISRKYGAEVPFKRPADISEDVPTEFVIQHAVNFIEKEEGRKVDIVVTLQATTPLLNGEDIDATIEKLVKEGFDSVITVKEVEEYPWWMMRMEKRGEKRGKVTPFLGQEMAGETMVRQTLETLYIPNGGAYATKRDVVMKESRIISKNCGAVVMPLERSVDIDTELDFKVVESIMWEGSKESMKRIKIERKKIGEGEPCFIIAEAGINHNGDLNLAKKLIDAARDAGADAIKFQTHLPEKEMLKDRDGTSSDSTAAYVGESLFGLLKRVELSKEELLYLKNYAATKGILFLSTPFSREAVDLLEEIGVQAYKVGSGEMTNFPLLKVIVEKRKPMIISTGMSTLEEIEEMVNFLKKFRADFAILHCTSTYPTRYEDVNLGVIEILRKRFKIPVGLSDHSIGIYTALASVALGACIVEKHFTISRDLPGPDQKASLEPPDLRELVVGVRAVEKALGDTKMVTEAELAVQKMARESVVALVDIPEGAVVTKDLVWVKRPGTGIPAKYLERVLGMRARRRIKKNTVIKWRDLEGIE